MENFFFNSMFSRVLFWKNKDFSFHFLAGSTTESFRKNNIISIPYKICAKKKCLWFIVTHLVLSNQHNGYNVFFF